MPGRVTYNCALLVHLTLGEGTLLPTNNLSSFLKRRWGTEAGYRQIVLLAIPLILSQAAMAIQQFVDRIFLAWYSAEAIAATMSAGVLNFTVMQLFIGTASYAGTFVAQYYGASQHKQIGPIVWQGLYVAAIAGVFHLALIPL